MQSEQIIIEFLNEEYKLLTITLQRKSSVHFISLKPIGKVS